jgi:hypothetical protein
MLEQPEAFNELLAWALRELARSGEAEGTR